MSLGRDQFDDERNGAASLRRLQEQYAAERRDERYREKLARSLGVAELLDDGAQKILASALQRTAVAGRSSASSSDDRLTACVREIQELQQQSPRFKQEVSNARAKYESACEKEKVHLEDLEIARMMLSNDLCKARIAPEQQRNAERASPLDPHVMARVSESDVEELQRQLQPVEQVVAHARAKYERVCEMEKVHLKDLEITRRMLCNELRKACIAHCEARNAPEQQRNAESRGELQQVVQRKRTATDSLKPQPKKSSIAMTMVDLGSESPSTRKRV